ncbi:MAG: hypothetical protein ACR2GY_06905 [Phycisphaerales bacterium]
MPQPLIHDAEADALLLQFVKGRDIACPRCNYNLRDLTQPRCPECQEPLALHVNVARVHFGWFLATISPCIFSGITTIFFTTMLTIGSIANNSLPPWPLAGTATFGWLSGSMGIGLLIHRIRFIRQRIETQRLWAILMWTAHFLALLALILTAMMRF